jgi:hypothetical protein
MLLKVNGLAGGSERKTRTMPIPERTILLFDQRYDEQ